MTSVSSLTRVAAIAEPGLIHQQITTALSSQADFQLAEVPPTLEKIAQHLHAARPDMVLMAHPMGKQSSLDVLDDLVSQFPEIAFVVILAAGELLWAQQAMLAGARGFLFQPFTQVNLLSTLRRVRDLELRRRVLPAAAAPGPADSASPLRVLAVFSPRGGAGTSTIAINLAIALMEETSLRVLLMEGKQFFGHLGVMLNLRVPNSLADLVPHAHTLEEAVVREVVVEHTSGLQVLLGPGQLEIAQGIRPETLFSMLTGLRGMYDVIVIDAGSQLSENTVTLMDAAERVLLVTLPELAALHDTSRFVQVTRTLAYPPGKVLTILNRAGLPGGVKPADIDTVFHQELFAHIPDDGPNALRSLNRGIPLTLKYPRSSAAQGIRQLARKLVRTGNLEAAPASAAPASAIGKRRARQLSAQPS